MFDGLDIEKLEAEDAKREEVRKTYGNVGPEELELSKMREGFMNETNEQNVRSLDRLEKSIEELSDEKSIISEDINKFSEEENKEEENTDSEEASSDDEDKNEEVEVADVNSDATETKPANGWEKEKEDLYSLMKQKDELLVKMYQEIQNNNKPQQVTEEKPVKKVEEMTEEDIVKQAKEIIKDISFAEEDNASDKLAKLLLTLSKSKKTEELDESKIEEILSKRDQKKYLEKFETVREDFFKTDEGKKILGDDELFDLYQVKFKRLQESGKHLNPEDLFKEAAKNTLGVFSNKTNTNSSMAKVPKVSESLKDDVSRAEDTKRKAIKPTSSSNAGNPAESKKFNKIDAYKEYLKSIGQTI